MNYVQCSAFVLSVILILSMITFVTNNTAYATHPSIRIDGEITEIGCRNIDGTIVNDTLDVPHTQMIELCKFGNKYYRIVYNTTCFVEQTGEGEDPYSGKLYFFNYICDVPRTCDPPMSWSEHPRFRTDYYEHVLKLKIESEQFNIITGSKGTVCTFELFNLEEKTVSIVAKGVQGTASSIEVTIPSEVLSGEFSIIVDGVDTEYRIERTETTSKIMLTLDFEQSVRNIEITGTQVIPEFPAFSLIIPVTILSFTLIAREFARFHLSEVKKQ